MRGRATISGFLISLSLAVSASGQVLKAPPQSLAPVTVQTPAPASVQNPAPAAPEERAPPSLVPSRPARPLRIEASAPGVRATLAAATDIIEVGKTLALTLTIETSAGVSASLPAIGDALGAFEIRGAMRSSSSVDGTRSTVLSFLATTYESGELEIPTITVDWKDASGEAQTLSLGPAPMEVVSLIGADFDPSQFRDIKGEVPIDLGVAWWLIISVVVVLAVAALLWFLRSRRHADAARQLSPQEWARLELDRLDRDALVESGDLHGFWVRLSGTVREYVERRFEIAAPEQTTKEFLAVASAHPLIGAEHRHLLTDFLRAADMVKFAAHRPGQKDCANGLSAARGFVDETAPAPAAEAELVGKS